MPLIAVVIAVSLYYAIPPFDPDGKGPKEGKIKLGLDLQGGMDLTLRVDMTKLDEAAQKDAADRVIEIIRNRIDQFGVSEPIIQKQSFDRITVQLPGVTDRERAFSLIGKTALLEFKIVSDNTEYMKEALAGRVPAGYRLYKTEDNRDILCEDRALLTGKHIKNAMVTTESQFNQPVVGLEFDEEGGKMFSDITGANVQKRMAIVLDDKVQSAPVINEQIPSGRAQISGSFNYDTASDLAITLRAGALPAPIIIEEERSVGASLGKDSVEKGIRAALIGCALVVVFMIVYYLFAGLIADVALALNILITLAALSYFHATLTLPGIAGVVLTIGMAVDANVLIFERIREELELKKPIAAALLAGYKKAFVTILDSNLTTLITAVILYYMGSGPVKGFALTLAIGLLASMFTGIFVTRVIFELLLSKGNLHSLPMMHVFKQVPHIDFMKLRKVCYAISILLTVVGLFAFFSRGKGMYGVDFTGGSMIEFKFSKPPEIEKIRKSLDAIGYGTSTLQAVAGTSQVIIRSPQGSEEKIKNEIKKDLPDNPYEVLRLESVGPIVGAELKQKALWASIASLVAIWIYVVWRFDFLFAGGAILALFHDGFVALSAVALTGREFSVGVLAAILTILGYSINDTIVVFDRIRERKRMGTRENFSQLINTSVNQTLSRTVLTSFTVFIVVLALLLFGGEVINDFAFTMLVGIITGTYSSIYIAAPVLVDWPGANKGRK
jgi:SecD/SecF fusion protein